LVELTSQVQVNIFYMQNKTVIGFIGAGNMAYALIKGLINNGYGAENIKISDLDEALLSSRNSELGVATFTDNTALIAECDVVILAVKPQVMGSVCKGLQGDIKSSHLFVSIAAGIRASDICRWLGGDYALVRTMPNTPALVQQGATGLFANDLVSDEHKAIVTSLLSAIGDCFWVAEEKLIDAITAISGSGPAYFFLMMQSMTQAGMALGLDEEAAIALSVKTALGASVMAANSDENPKQLRANVTSPNGTTQAAIEAFQDQNFEGIVANATRAAYDRAHELSVQLGDVD
jgi:pyrroline-5-carboxylate reductase